MTKFAPSVVIIIIVVVEVIIVIVTVLTEFDSLSVRPSHAWRGRKMECPIIASLY